MEIKIKKKYRINTESIFNMKNKEPFFTIITPVYKGEAFLEQTLNSLKNQTFGDFEHLIVNDGSLGINEEDFISAKDPTFERSLNFLDLPKDKTKQAEFIFNKIVGKDNRFVFFSKENGGQSSARNFAIKKAKGKFLLNLDQDDYFLPDHLEKIYNSLLKYKEYWNSAIFPYKDHTEFYIKDGEVVFGEGPALKQVAKNLNHNTLLIFTQVSLTFGTISRDFLGDIFYTNNTPGMEDAEIVYNVMLREQSLGRILNFLSLDTTGLMKRNHPDSFTVKDVSAGSPKEAEGRITVYKSMLDSGILTFRQSLICYLGIFRFSIHTRKEPWFRFVRKIATFFSKLIAGWWL